VEDSTQGGRFDTGWKIRHRVEDSTQGGRFDTGWKIRHRVEDSYSSKMNAEPMACRYPKMKAGVVLPK